MKKQQRGRKDIDEVIDFLKMASGEAISIDIDDILLGYIKDDNQDIRFEIPKYEDIRFEIPKYEDIDKDIRNRQVLMDDIERIIDPPL